MLRKTLFIALPILLLFSGLFFFYYRLRVSRETPAARTAAGSLLITSKDKEQVPRGSRVHLHPLADAGKLAEAKQKPVTTWDEWVDATVEILLAEAILYGEVETPNLSMLWVEDTPEKVTQQRAWLREALTRYRKRYEWWLKPPPAYPGGLQSITLLGIYQGPQPPTAESLIAEFDAVYNKNPTGYLDEHFPKEQWLEMLLEKGANFNKYSDYEFLLGLRKSLLRQKDKPDDWRSGAHGIPITTNFDEYTDGFISRKVWEYSIIQKVRAENPGTSPMVFFPSNHPDKYLPAAGELSYVRLGPDRQRMSTWGTMLTAEQRDNLQNRGIEPEGIEIVYIDDDYNLVSEPPPLFDEQKYIRENAISFDGIELTPENYEQVLNHPMPARWLENYEERQARDTPPPIPNTDAIDTAARDAALQAQERFQQGLSELERLSNMSDAEIEAELERRFLPQIPEIPTAENIENRLWSEVQSAQMTPTRFAAALKILEQYGPEEGMQKLTEADPKAAAQVQRIMGVPPDSERPPVPPEPNR